MRIALFFVVTFIAFSCHPVKRAQQRSQLSSLLEARNQISTNLNKLAQKNDSLKKAGFYSPAYSDKITEQINNYKKENDSVRNNIEHYYRKANFKIAYEEEYYTIRTKINTLLTETKKETKAAEILGKIDKQMSETDLAGEKKALTQILDNADAKQGEAKQKSLAIGNQKDSILKTGNISVAAAQTIDTRLKAYQSELDSVAVEISTLRTQIEDQAYFGNNIKTIKAKVFLIDSIVNKKVSYQIYVFRLIEDGFTKSKRTMFNMAAFFGPGGYTIPENKYAMAEQYFGVILDSLIEFSNKYPDIIRKAQISVIGYADATNISKKSSVYPILTKQLNKENATREELNQALSALRAADLSKFMEWMVKKRGIEFTGFDKIIFEILESGEGENYPDPKITDYKTNDERRRIVVLFWSVLPLK